MGEAWWDHSGFIPVLSNARMLETSWSKSSSGGNSKCGSSSKHALLDFFYLVQSFSYWNPNFRSLFMFISFSQTHGKNKQMESSSSDSKRVANWKHDIGIVEAKALLAQENIHHAHLRQDVRRSRVPNDLHHWKKNQIFWSVLNFSGYSFSGCQP